MRIPIKESLIKGKCPVGFLPVPQMMTSVDLSKATIWGTFRSYHEVSGRPARGFGHEIFVFFFSRQFLQVFLKKHDVCVYIKVDQFSVLDFYRKTHRFWINLIKFKHQKPMISSRNDCPYHLWDRKTGWCPSPRALESCAQRKCDQRPGIGHIFVGTKAGGGQL